MKIFLSVVVLFFAVLGLAEFIRGLSFYALVPKDKVRRVIVPVKDLDGYFDVMAEFELIRRYDEKNTVVFALDIGMDAETRQLCDKEAESNPSLIVCGTQEFCNILDN